MFGAKGRGSRSLALVAALGLWGCESSDDPPPGPGPVLIPQAGSGVAPVPPDPISGPSVRPPQAVPEILDGPVVMAKSGPPPISGGTLLSTRDGQLLVAADPDRDQLYFIDVASRALRHVRTLQSGDEPGRLVEDGAGRIHVALRGGHAIASMTRDEGSPIVRRAACDLPRGLAYDPAQDALQLACAEGKLVTLPAAPDAAATRVVDVGRDARDVFVRGDELFVTRFRSAELVRVAADGSLRATYTPPSFSNQVFPNHSLPVGTPMLDPELQTTTPTTAWRALDVPGKGAILLHQRALTAEIQIQLGGYGAGSCGGGIVQSSITVGLDGGKVVSADLAEPTLAVDMASDPDGVLLAVVAPGNFGTQHQLLLFSITGSSPLNPNAPAPTAPEFSPDAPGGMFVPPTPCMVSSSLPQDPSGQATAVTFVSANELAVQEREPAGISFIDTRTGQLRKHVDLGQPSRFDTGHAIFHQRAGAGIACASCHAEAGDDGHVWTFHDIGARRTQTLRGGILGTEPLHWNGDMQDFPTLVEEVFVGRMAGFTPSAAQTDSLSHWIDRQPALSAVAADAASAARGEALFQSEAVGCSGCHSGVHLTNNQFADVGTGAMLQVPSLRGVSFRLPVMHDGCASTLSRRFDAACGGGDSHGHTSQLAPNQLVDLIAYLETL